MTASNRAAQPRFQLPSVALDVPLVGRLARAGPRHAGRFARFLTVGLSGVFVNMGMLWFLTEVGGVYYLLSSLAAVESSIVTNFLLNNAWTFRDRSHGEVSPRALCRYNLVCLGGIVMSSAILYSLTTWVGVYYLLANLAAMSVTALWNFAANASWTWRAGSVDS